MSDQKRIPGWVAGVGLALGGMTCAGVLILLFFTVFPQYRPGYTVFTVGMGDIFFNQAEWVKKPENPNEIIAAYPISWDENGLRIPERQADFYPIFAIGDSFTEAPNAPRPWTDVLAAERGMPVRNLAYRGFGPAEYRRILERFSSAPEVQTVVIGFFEGNDLSNALSSQDKPGEMPWEIAASQRPLIQTEVERTTEERYPMQVSINGIDYDVAFYEYYAWILNTGRNAFRNSLNLQLAMQSFEAMREMMPDACMVVAYFPTKPHIYLPYLKPEYQPILMQKAERFSADRGEPLRQTPVPNQPFEELLGRLPNMRDVVKEEMEAAGLVFFDLTPVLENAAAQGQMLYYTYDTHWNQAGHGVVGKAISDFLQTNPCEA